MTIVKLQNLPAKSGKANPHHPMALTQTHRYLASYGTMVVKLNTKTNVLTKDEVYANYSRTTTRAVNLFISLYTNKDTVIMYGDLQCTNIKE